MWCMSKHMFAAAEEVSDMHHGRHCSGSMSLQFVLSVGLTDSVFAELLLQPILALHIDKLHTDGYRCMCLSWYTGEVRCPVLGHCTLCLLCHVQVPTLASSLSLTPKDHIFGHRSLLLVACLPASLSYDSHNHLPILAVLTCSCKTGWVGTGTGVILP